MRALAVKSPKPVMGEWGKIVRDVGVFESHMPDLFADECTIQDIEDYFFFPGAKDAFREDMKRFELVEVKVIRGGDS